MKSEDYKVDVPEGKVGAYRIERFTVDKHGSQMSFITGKGRGVSEGTYTRLMRGEDVVMSDTYDEVRDHHEAIWKAKGHCLVNGLGIGMVLQAMANKPEVTMVTAIEISPEVIELVGPHYLKRFPDKVEIIQANAFEYQPPKNIRYGAVWHDIWGDMCEDNLPEMHKLHRKYGRRADWQGSWSRIRIELEKRRTADAWWRNND